MEFKIPVTQLIRQRRSVRNYSPDGMEPDMERQVREVLDLHTEGPMGNRVAFHLVHRKSAIAGQKVKLGTYGFIKGAQHFVAGEVKIGTFTELDFGYLLEKIMLYLVDMGLGTCWLGGTFKRSELADILNTSEDVVIPAITPVGYPAPSMSRRELLIRKGAKSDQRKPWNELFFDGEFGKPLQHMDNEGSLLPLEMVRLAPSASNKQPWRVVRSENNFHFYLNRTPGYGGFAPNVDIQHIDMGIAMAHFELSSWELGIEGSWKIMDHGKVVKKGTEYIVSWQTNDDCVSNLSPSG
ncbi:MAG TPA: nitroreductase [Bacteroides sp.]|nr:nitroreductase [Bacteroides sp.]